jgi:hypothetical protein
MSGEIAVRLLLATVSCTARKLWISESAIVGIVVAGWSDGRFERRGNVEIPDVSGCPGTVNLWRAGLDDPGYVGISGFSVDEMTS